MVNLPDNFLSPENLAWDTSVDELRYLGICLEYFGPIGRKEDKLMELLSSGVDETWFSDERNSSLFVGIFKAAMLIGQKDITANVSGIIQAAEQNCGEVGWAATAIRDALASVGILNHQEYVDNDIPVWWSKLRKPKIQKVIGEVYRLLEASPTVGKVQQVERLLEVAQEEWIAVPEISRKQEGLISSVRDLVLQPRKESACISTGLAALDFILGGGFAGEDSLEEGKLIVVMGRPGSGKTLFATTLAMRVILKQEAAKVAFWSLEMNAKQLAMRIIAGHDHDVLMATKADYESITYDRLRTGYFEDEMVERLKSRNYDKLDQNLSVYGPAPDITVHSVIKKMKLIIKKHPETRLFVIDHLGLFSLTNNNEVAGIGEITRTLKLTAVSLGVDIILLSQLNRGVEGRADKKPAMSDARGSGRIEEDADVILGLYREHYYDKSADPHKLEICCLKNRQGASGDFPVRVKLDCCVVYD